MKSVLCRKRGMMVMSFAVLFGFILFSAVMLSGVVSGGLAEAMTKAATDLGTPQSFSGEMGESDFNQYAAYFGSEEEAIKALSKNADDDTMKELVDIFYLDDEKLVEINNAFKGDTKNPRYKEFLQELAVKKWEKSDVNFNIADIEGGSIEIGEDQLIVKKGEQEVIIEMTAVEDGSSIDIDSEGNVKVSKGDLSITTDQGTVEGMTVKGAKNGGVEYDATVTNGDVTIKGENVELKKNAKAEITVGDKTSTVTGESGESSLQVLGENSFSGKDFSVSNDVYDGKVAGDGAIGNKEALANYDGSKASIDKKNVELNSEKNGAIELHPKEEGWTYSADKKSGVEGAPVDGNVPIPEGGSLILDKEGGVDVKLANGEGATANNDGTPVVETDPKPKPQPDGKPCGPDGCGSEGDPSGQPGGGGGEDMGKAIADAIAGLQFPPAPEGGEPVPAGDLGGKGGPPVLDATNPGEDNCVVQGVSGVDCAGGDCPPGCLEEVLNQGGGTSESNGGSGTS